MVSAFTHRITVCVFLINNQNQILLFERTNTETSRGVFVVGGGSVDPGEDVLTAAVREMEEELAVHVERNDLELVGVFDRPSQKPDEKYRVVQFYFRARKWQGVPRNNEPYKHADPAWYALNNLPEKFHRLDKMIVERGFSPQVMVM